MGIRLLVRHCMCPHYMLFHWSRLNWSKITLIAFMWLSSRACHLVFLKVVPNTFGCVSYCGALTGRTDGGGQKLLSNSVTRTLHLHTLRHQYQQKSNSKTCFFLPFFFYRNVHVYLKLKDMRKTLLPRAITRFWINHFSWAGCISLTGKVVAGIWNDFLGELKPEKGFRIVSKWASWCSSAQWPACSMFCPITSCILCSFYKWGACTGVHPAS